jgi:hypothetical protein
MRQAQHRENFSNALPYVSNTLNDSDGSAAAVEPSSPWMSRRSLPVTAIGNLSKFFRMIALRPHCAYPSPR